MAQLGRLATSLCRVFNATTKAYEDKPQPSGPSFPDAVNTTHSGLLSLSDELLLTVLELVVGVVPPHSTHAPSLVTLWDRHLPQFAINKRLFKLAKRALVPRCFDLVLHPAGQSLPLNTDDVWTFERAHAWLEECRNDLSRVLEVRLSLNNPLKLRLQSQSVQRFTRDMVHLQRLHLTGWPSGLLNEQNLLELPSSLRLLKLANMEVPTDVLRSILLQLPRLAHFRLQHVTALAKSSRQGFNAIEHLVAMPPLPPGIGGGVLPTSPEMQELVLLDCNFAPRAIMDVAHPLSSLTLMFLLPNSPAILPNIKSNLPPSLTKLSLGLNAEDSEPKLFQSWFYETFEKLEPTHLPHLRTLMLFEHGPKTPVTLPIAHTATFFRCFSQIRHIELRVTASSLSLSILRGFEIALATRSQPRLKSCKLIVQQFAATHSNAAFLLNVALQTFDALEARNFALVAQQGFTGTNDAVELWRLTEGNETHPGGAEQNEGHRAKRLRRR